MNGPGNPHEERFNMLKMNETFSKIPRIPSADFSKQLGRYNATIYKVEKFQPDYNPNHEVGKRRFLCGPEFGRRGI
jgi:nicotinic acid mononucleotide adenylyltransferase